LQEKPNPMKLLIILFTLLIASNANAQDTITSKQVNQYLNKEVVLKGKIVHIKDYQTDKGDKMVFIDIDEKYPDNLISIAIYEEVVTQIKPSIYDYLNKQVYIKGKITKYRIIPSIELKKPEFLKQI
jgi:DNA polymerase III alpha subunit